MASIINFEDTTGRKFQLLADGIREMIPTITAGEQAYGILGLVNRVEDYLSTLIERKLGTKVSFIKDVSPGYVHHIQIASSVPVMVLKRKLVLDIIKAAKTQQTDQVIAAFKKELHNYVLSVRNGDLEESYAHNLNYIIFEVEASPLPAAQQGTLASFRGVMPVDKVSLIDTEKEKDYVPKEVAKNVFVLHPTAEQLRAACIRALSNKGLSENELNSYLTIARNGKFKIIKEHLSESTNYDYTRLGDKITLSPIRYK